MAMIFDSHAHYDAHHFNEDRDALLSSMLGDTVCGIIQCGTDPASCRLSVDIAANYDGVYAAVGFHPSELEGITDNDLENCRNLLSHPKVVAVGEIGLDYYWDSSPRPVQQDWFLKQMAMAEEANLPVIVHDREAHEDTLTLLKQAKPRGVVHAFSGSAEMASEILKLGMYLGVGGVVTYKNARKLVEVVQSMPLERLLLETDAPYLTPEPLRGHRNHSANIRYVAKKIGELRNMSADDILDITADNARRLFAL